MITREEHAQQEAYNIGCANLRWIDSTYGTGFPHYLHYVGENGVEVKPDHELAYHNGHHARMVGYGALLLGSALDFSPVELAMVEATGLTHDIWQTGERSFDEAQSAELMIEQLKEANKETRKSHGYELFPRRLIAMAGLAILATEPIFENGLIVGQMVDRLKYPSKRAEVFAKTVASADLGELYTPQGPIVGHEYYREIQGANGRDEEPGLEGLLDFQRAQQVLLETYTYPLPIAERVLATHRGPVVAYSAYVLRQLERGNITSWDQLRESDHKFFQDQLAA